MRELQRHKTWTNVQRKLWLIRSGVVRPKTALYFPTGVTHWVRRSFFRKLAFAVIKKVLKFLNFVFSSESSELSRIETNNKMTIKRTQSRLHTSRMPQKTLSNWHKLTSLLCYNFKKRWELILKTPACFPLHSQVRLTWRAGVGFRPSAPLSSRWVEVDSRLHDEPCRHKTQLAESPTASNTGFSLGSF